MFGLFFLAPDMHPASLYFRTFKQKNALTEKFIPVGHLHLIGRFTIQKIFFNFFSKVRNPVK